MLYLKYLKARFLGLFQRLTGRALWNCPTLDEWAASDALRDARRRRRARIGRIMMKSLRQQIKEKSHAPQEKAAG